MQRPVKGAVAQKKPGIIGKLAGNGGAAQLQDEPFSVPGGEVGRLAPLCYQVAVAAPVEIVQNVRALGVQPQLLHLVLLPAAVAEKDQGLPVFPADLLYLLRVLFPAHGKQPGGEAAFGLLFEPKEGLKGGAFLLVPEAVKAGY